MNGVRTRKKRTRKPSPAAAARCERRRAEILEAATQLFAAEGYANLDLQVLADALGVGKGTLYRHFVSKEKLFLAALDCVILQLHDYVESRSQKVEDSLEKIACAIRAYLEFFHHHPEAIEMLIQERAQFKDRKRPTYFEHRDANVERWRDIYRGLISDGHVRAFSPEHLSDIIGNLLYGTMFVNYIAKRNLPPDVVAEEIIEIVFHGILTDQGRRNRSRLKNAAKVED